MQVMTRGGDLGITSLDETLLYRQTPEYIATVVKRYYAIRPEEWAVGHYSVPANLQPDYC